MATINQLKQIVDNAKAGNESAITVLRSIVVSAAGSAPTSDLIRLGECLINIGKDATNRKISEN